MRAFPALCVMMKKFLQLPAVVAQLILLGRALVLGLLLVGLTTAAPRAQATAPGILITEVLAANARTVTDDQGPLLRLDRVA